MVAENLAQVQKNIEESCRNVNRDPGEVTLIAVSISNCSWCLACYDHKYHNNRNKYQHTNLFSFHFHCFRLHLIVFSK